MRKLLVMGMLLAGCRKEQLPDMYSGVSSEDVACSWDIVHPDRGQCVSQGRRYRCVRKVQENDTHVWYHVSCTPFSHWR